MHSKILKDGDRLAMPYGSARYPELERFFSVITLRGCYFENNGKRPLHGAQSPEDAQARLEKARLDPRNSDCWMSPQSTCLSSSPAHNAKAAAERDSAMRVNYGDLIGIDDGEKIRYFRIARNRSNNPDWPALEEEIRGTVEATAEAATERVPVTLAGQLAMVEARIKTCAIYTGRRAMVACNTIVRSSLYASRMVFWDLAGDRYAIGHRKMPTTFPPADAAKLVTEINAQLASDPECTERVMTCSARDWWAAQAEEAERIAGMLREAIAAS